MTGLIIIGILWVVFVGFLVGSLFLKGLTARERDHLDYNLSSFKYRVTKYFKERTKW